MDVATDISASHTLPARLPKGFVLEGCVVDGWLRDGGMAAIYRARRVSDDRRVALKLQLPSTAHDLGIGQRFDLEAELMRRTSDCAHVVELLDAGVLDDGRRWLMMEWVEGEDLEELLDFLRNQDQRLSLARACRIGRDVARGLAELHGHGVVHLDLKPANVMVGQRDDGGDVVELVDFGIAADLRQEAPRGSGTGASIEGVLGTSAYMPPEQVAGAPCNPSFDLYAWGVLMFEALSGSCLPPDGWSPETLPKLETLRRGVPRALAGLVRACMDADPRRRPESADAVARALVGIIRVLESSGGQQAASSDGIPVRTGGTEVVLRSGIVAAATVGHESGAVQARVEVVPQSGVMATAEVRESRPVPARTGETEIVHQPALSAAVRDSADVLARAGGTEVVMTHQDVLRSSGIAPVLTTEMVADAMDRLAAQEEIQRSARRRKRRGRWGVAGAVVIAAVVVGGVWVGLGAEASGPDSAMAGEVFTVAADASDSEPAGPEHAAPSRQVAPTPAVDGGALHARDAESRQETPDVAVVPSRPIEPASDDYEASTTEDDEPEEHSTAVPDPKASASEPRVNGPSERMCARQRDDAIGAKSSREWQKVLQATVQRSCWSSPSLRLERKRLRVQALAERGEFRKCVKEGGRVQDQEVANRVGFCKKRLDGESGPASPFG